MAKSKEPKEVTVGPFCYENWRVEKDEVHITFEVPLFTDAYVVGELLEELGPYQIFNTGGSHNELLQPALVLRAAMRLPQANYNEDYFKKKDISRYHGGDIFDEVAALVALSTGMRLEAGNITRRFFGNDFRGTPQNTRMKADPVLLKNSTSVLPYFASMRRMRDLRQANLISSLPSLKPSQAIALVRAARLYQDAVWVADSEPALAWLFFVSAVEIAAESFDSTRSNAVRLQEDSPDIASELLTAGGENLLASIADKLAHLLKSTEKFRTFLLNFWPPAPSLRPPDLDARIHWSKETEEDTKLVRKTLTQIYECRSDALHSGIPFPYPMCQEPEKRWEVPDVPAEKPSSLAVAAWGGIWPAKELPMYLHTFEYIVQSSLMSWWNSMIMAAPAAAAPAAAAPAAAAPAAAAVREDQDGR